jgi:hypothetical protein
VLIAIKDSGGIKTVIARRLSVTRQTVDAYLRKWVTAQEAYDAEGEINLDVAESVIVQNIRTAAKIAQTGAIADSGDAWKYLKLKGKHRGYVERQEVTGADGGDLIINVTLSDDD